VINVTYETPAGMIVFMINNHLQVYLYLDKITSIIMSVFHLQKRIPEIPVGM